MFCCNALCFLLHSYLQCFLDSLMQNEVLNNCYSTSCTEKGYHALLTPNPIHEVVRWEWNRWLYDTHCELFRVMLHLRRYQSVDTSKTISTKCIRRCHVHACVRNFIPKATQNMLWGILKVWGLFTLLTQISKAFFWGCPRPFGTDKQWSGFQSWKQCCNAIRHPMLSSKAAFYNTCLLQHLLLCKLGHSILHVFCILLITPRFTIWLSHNTKYEVLGVHPFQCFLFSRNIS